MSGAMDLFAVLDATWPGAELAQAGGFTVRRGAGGGRRVSAARASGEWSEADIDATMAQQATWDQSPLFQVVDGDTALAEALTARGMQPCEATILMVAPIAALNDKPVPPVTAFCIWPPMAIQRDLWAQGGIGPDRLAVMDRARAPKTAVLGRVDDRAGGTAFVALHKGVAMIHSVEVAPDHRRKGMGEWIMRGAALWAADQGATHFALAVSRANDGAIALYEKLGFSQAGGYSYYALPDPDCDACGVEFQKDAPKDVADQKP